MAPHCIQTQGQAHVIPVWVQGFGGARLPQLRSDPTVITCHAGLRFTVWPHIAFGPTCTRCHQYRGQMLVGRGPTLHQDTGSSHVIPVWGSMFGEALSTPCYPGCGFKGLGSMAPHRVVTQRHAVLGLRAWWSVALNCNQIQGCPMSFRSST